MGAREYYYTLKELVGVMRTRRYLAPRPLDEIDSVGLKVEENAARIGARPMILFEGREVTWSEFNALANRYAHTLKSRGIGHGDVVSLMMENRIEFLAVLVAISKLGAVTSLINTNLRGRPLTHCITVTQSKACVFGEELSNAIAEVKADLPLHEGADYLFVADQGVTPPPNWAVNLSAEANGAPTTNLPETQRIKLGDNSIYMFTSGTTGLPKAAVVSQRRFLATGAMACKAALKIRRNRPTLPVSAAIPRHRPGRRLRVDAVVRIIDVSAPEVLGLQLPQGGARIQHQLFRLHRRAVPISDDAARAL